MTSDSRLCLFFIGYEDRIMGYVSSRPNEELHMIISFSPTHEYLDARFSPLLHMYVPLEFDKGFKHYSEALETVSDWIRSYMKIIKNNKPCREIHVYTDALDGEALAFAYYFAVAIGNVLKSPTTLYQVDLENKKIYEFDTEHVIDSNALLYVVSSMTRIIKPLKEEAIANSLIATILPSILTRRIRLPITIQVGRHLLNIERLDKRELKGTIVDLENASDEYYERLDQQLKRDVKAIKKLIDDMKKPYKDEKLIHDMIKHINSHYEMMKKLDDAMQKILGVDENLS